MEAVDIAGGVALDPAARAGVVPAVAGEVELQIEGIAGLAEADAEVTGVGEPRIGLGGGEGVVGGGEEDKVGVVGDAVEVEAGPATYRAILLNRWLPIRCLVE